MSAYLDRPRRSLDEVQARKTCGDCSWKGTGPIAVCKFHDIAVSYASDASECREFENDRDDESDGDDGAAGKSDPPPRVWRCGWVEKSNRCLRFHCSVRGPCEGYSGK